MRGPRQAIIAVAAALAASLWLVAGGGIAVAQSVPASGRYQCAGASGAMAELNFTVGPGNIYTTTKGFRGTMSVHPGTGNLLFHVAPPKRPTRPVTAPARRRKSVVDRDGRKERGNWNRVSDALKARPAQRQAYNVTGQK